eukprot:XP_022279550.1 uncharacterized protein LOC102151918 isoform X3 [Canis lupus familiaris]
MTIVTPIIQRKKLRLRDILPRWCGEGKSPRQDCSEKAPGDRIHHFLILSGSYLRLTQDDDLTDLTERVLRDWTLPRGRNQSIYFTSEACDLGRATSPLWTSVSSSVTWSCQLPKQLGSRWDKMRRSRRRAEKPRSRNRPCSLLPPGGGRRENRRAGGPGRQEEGSAEAPRPARPRNVTRGAQEVLIQRLSLRPKTDTHGQGGLRLRPRKTHASPRPPGESMARGIQAGFQPLFKLDFSPLCSEQPVQRYIAAFLLSLDYSRHTQRSWGRPHSLRS